MPDFLLSMADLYIRLLSVIVWPAVTVFAFWWFREPLVDLVSRASRFKSGEHELEFAAAEMVGREHREAQQDDATIDEALANMDPHSIRLLLALSGEVKQMPLSMYNGLNWNKAKVDLLERGLAVRVDGGTKYELTQPGCRYASRQVAKRLNSMR